MIGETLPATFVIVAPSAKTVVPSGASQTVSFASFGGLIATSAPPLRKTETGRIMSAVAFSGAVLSTVQVVVDAGETFPAASIT